MKVYNLKGKKFGELTVLERDYSRKNRAYWICRCSCGSNSIVNSSNLTSGNIKTCKSKLHLAENILGIRFGELTVLERDWTRTERAFWICSCNCGGTKSVAAKHLRGGNIKSCNAICHKIGNKNSHWKGYKEISGKYWNRVVKGAIKRDLEITVTIENVWDIFIQQNRRCTLTGEILTLIDENGIHQGFGTASLDRIDNSKGYIEGNIQWVHKDINCLKSSLKQEKFIELCNKVANYTHKTLEQSYEAFTFI